MKRTFAAILALLLISNMLTGCSKTPVVDNIAKYTTSVEYIKMEDEVKIVGLGEATHGNSELQSLKLEVFKALIENNNCRVFAIEGDFGGGTRINDFIHGKESSTTGNTVTTAEEAAREIGFAIYRTKEMAELIQWMKDYNQNAAESEKLSFYGFDMQRYDNNKEYLFSYLDKNKKEANQEVSRKYRELLADLNDESVYTQDKDKIKKGLAAINELMELLSSNKDEYISKSSVKEFDFAYQCAQSIEENATLQISKSNYAALRDEYMKNKVDWILKQEEEQMIFITGHNGYIMKTSNMPTVTVMGELLSDTYDVAYYAIGTDCLESNFRAVTSSGKDKEFSLKHTNSLTAQFKGVQENISYLDLTEAQKDSSLKELVNKSQSMNIGNEFDSWKKISSFFYTIKMSPSKAYDGLIILKNAEPSVRID
ncbi:MAG: erythromycin esterase family protein [Anaerocolumna sp.]|jgi:erythromycin esterase|nr:erythromycin esterase family protein [Anaerocolumna sp.]